jgi:hypothetical protein
VRFMAFRLESGGMREASRVFWAQASPHQPRHDHL